MQRPSPSAAPSSPSPARPSSSSSSTRSSSSFAPSPSAAPGAPPPSFSDFYHQGAGPIAQPPPKPATDPAARDLDRFVMLQSAQGFWKLDDVFAQVILITITVMSIAVVVFDCNNATLTMFFSRKTFLACTTVA